MNSDANKQKRREYVEKLMTFQGNGKTIIFQDESNLNLFCRRTQARAPKGSRALVPLPSSKGFNIHILGLMSQTGLLAWNRRRGSVKKETFGE